MFFVLVKKQEKMWASVTSFRVTLVNQSFRVCKLSLGTLNEGRNYPWLRLSVTFFFQTQGSWRSHLYFYLQVSCSWTGVRIYMSVWIIIRHCDTHKKLVFLESQLESLADTFYDWDFTTLFMRKNFSQIFFVTCSTFVRLSLSLCIARLIQLNLFHIWLLSLWIIYRDLRVIVEAFILKNPNDLFVICWNLVTTCFSFVSSYQKIFRFSLSCVRSSFISRLPLYVARLIQQKMFLNSRFARCCWVIHRKKSWWFILVVSKSFDDVVSCRIIIVSFCQATCT